MAFYIAYKDTVLGSGMTKKRAEIKLRELEVSFAGLHIIELSDKALNRTKGTNTKPFKEHS
ncbi:hypothetical protein SY83_15280 [Paenibacillus swuensis]|uniref:Uncharacterized protein n=1 Tax=Paenibacillus swuensis TaxID=1178515 RepID=A0A172TK21_9BACL|nr:hypothetical protein [Paenibacillus swuensis]ANE47409.1 hypothetical protein SY83_15280 [Paenibacillus swuensis]